MFEPASKKIKLEEISNRELSKYLGFENKFCVIKWHEKHRGLVYSIVNQIKIIAPFSARESARRSSLFCSISFCNL